MGGVCSDGGGALTGSVCGLGLLVIWLQWIALWREGQQRQSSEESSSAPVKKKTETRKYNNENDERTRYSSSVTKLVLWYWRQWRRIVETSDLKVSSWLKRDRAVSLRKQDTSRRGKGGKNRHSCRITDPQFKISDHQFITGFALVLRCGNNRNECLPSVVAWTSR